MALLLVGMLACSGCVGDDGDLAALQLTAPEDDAHCQSLLMRPGELVYAQCRLALRRTYLKDYAARKQSIESRYGPVGNDLDAALRNDTFCNYDESVKASVEPLDEETAADEAYAQCGKTREELETAFVNASGGDAVDFTDRQRAIIRSQNVESVREARAVIGGPA